MDKEAADMKTSLATLLDELDCRYKIPITVYQENVTKSYITLHNIVSKSLLLIYVEYKQEHKRKQN